MIEMACGTGKTRVMKELVGNVSGKVTGIVYRYRFSVPAFEHDIFSFQEPLVPTTVGRKQGLDHGASPSLAGPVCS